MKVKVDMYRYLSKEVSHCCGKLWTVEEEMLRVFLLVAARASRVSNFLYGVLCVFNFDIPSLICV